MKYPPGSSQVSVYAEFTRLEAFDRLDSLQSKFNSNSEIGTLITQILELEQRDSGEQAVSEFDSPNRSRLQEESKS